MPRVYNYAVLTAGDMSQATLTSTVVPLSECTYCSFQYVYTGSPVGTIQVQASNDNVNFTNIDRSLINITAAGSSVVNLSEIGYIYARVLYTKTSGTGSLTITVGTK